MMLNICAALGAVTFVVVAVLIPEIVHAVWVSNNPNGLPNNQYYWSEMPYPNRLMAGTKLYSPAFTYYVTVDSGNCNLVIIDNGFPQYSNLNWMICMNWLMGKPYSPGGTLPSCSMVGFTAPANGVVPNGCDKAYAMINADGTLDVYDNSGTSVIHLMDLLNRNNLAGSIGYNLVLSNKGLLKVTTSASNGSNSFNANFINGGADFSYCTQADSNSNYNACGGSDGDHCNGYSFCVSNPNIPMYQPNTATFNQFRVGYWQRINQDFGAVPSCSIGIYSDFVCYTKPGLQCGGSYGQCGVQQEQYYWTIRDLVSPTSNDHQNLRFVSATDNPVALAIGNYKDNSCNSQTGLYATDASQSPSYPPWFVACMLPFKHIVDGSVDPLNPLIIDGAYGCIIYNKYGFLCATANTGSTVSLDFGNNNVQFNTVQSPSQCQNNRGIYFNILYTL